MIFEVVIRGLPVERLTDRRKARLRAEQEGWFWLPCPLCGQEFAGHEWVHSAENSIPTDDPTLLRGICPACTTAGFGRIIAAGICTADYVRSRIVFR